MAEPFDWQREYSPSSMIGGDLTPIIDDWQRRSAAVADAADVEHRADGSLLIRGDRADSPLLVFVHGGYWRALSAAESLYLARDYVRDGWSFLAAEYSIAPAGTITQMIDQTRATLADAATMGASRIVALGHSAGAHLLAMAALVQQPPCTIDRLVLVSGIYDCRHVVHLDVNDVVHLDATSARALSPLLQPLRGRTGAVDVLCGEIETAPFRQMSRDFAAYCGVPYTEVAGRHHFDVVESDEVSGSCRR